MRQISIFIFGIILISSCSEVRFSTPQPQGSVDLDGFPSEFIGRYLGQNGDTLSIEEDYFLFADDEIKMISSDRVTLRKEGDLHIVSCRELMMAGDKLQRKGWEVLPFELVNDSLFVYFLNTTNEEASLQTIAQLETILKVEEIFTKDHKVEYFYIDPSVEQFKNILSTKCFTTAEKFARIE